LLIISHKVNSLLLVVLFVLVSALRSKQLGSLEFVLVVLLPPLEELLVL
jgi:hypothetical protein